MAVIGAGADQDRSIAALNIALAAARDGAKVLLIDADLRERALSGKVSHLAKSEPSRFGWLNIGAKASRAIETANVISILPAVNTKEAKACDAIRKAIAQARSTGGYDLVILDGPAMPWSPTDRKLLDMAEGLVAILPVHLDINDSMEDIIAALGGTERKLVGVVLGKSPDGRQSAAGQAICVNVAQIPSAEPPRPAYPASRWAGCGLPCCISADRELHDRHRIPATPPQSSALSDLGQWRGPGALLDRSDDRPAAAGRRSDQCRRPAAGDRVAVQVKDTAARTRRDHRPVSRRCRQGAGRRPHLLHAGRGRGRERRRGRQRSRAISRSQDRRPLPRLSAGRGAACQGRRNQRAGAGLSLGRARRSL